MNTVRIDTIEIEAASGATIVADIRYNDCTGNWYARYLDGGLRIADKRQIATGNSEREVFQNLYKFARAS